MNPIISACNRKNLIFKAENLGDVRTDEIFQQEALSAEKNLDIRNTVDLCMQLLDEKYWPSQLHIDLETEAQMIFPDGFKENIPVSLITSQQQPSKSRIRMGMFELNGDAEAFKSILAHEMGHMLPEWACRKVGVTQSNDQFINHWSKPIYEGVADWVGAVISNSTIIGSKKIWFHRDILAWNSLSDAQNTVGAMAKLVNESLNASELTKYRAYREWVELVDKYLGDQPDPYAEGQWIAKQLWELSDKQNNSKKIFNAIIEVAISGKKINKADSFLSDIKIQL